MAPTHNFIMYAYSAVKLTFIIAGLYLRAPPSPFPASTAREPRLQIPFFNPSTNNNHNNMKK